MTYIESITKVAIELLEGGWCQRAYARDANGKPVTDLFYEGAVSYSIMGAMHRSCQLHRAEGAEIDRTLNAFDAVWMKDKMWHADFNNDEGRTVEQVIKKIKSVTKRMKSEEGAYYGED